MHNLTISAQVQGLRNKKFSSVELVQHYLNRINKHKNLNAFIRTTPDYAIKMAQEADKNLAKGNAPLLCGIPMAHKDIFCTIDVPTTCASKMLESYISPFSATIVNKLLAAQTIMLGKTNLDEFAMGASGETSHFGATLNPWDIKHVPGGSSSGSAAAVAARLVPFATTTDTGGSTRQPAAFCGLSGIKPTYGLVSRFGQIAYASSFDQAGIVTTNIPDLALTIQAIIGYDPMDATSINKPAPDLSKDLDKPIKSLKIGVPKCILNATISDDVKQSVLDAVDVYKDLGAEVIDIDLKLVQTWLATYQILASAEASANLARYDGIRFGHSSKNTKNIAELITTSRTEGFGEEVKNRIIAGTYTLTNHNSENHYQQAQKVRNLITEELKACLNQVDAILFPTSPSEAYKFDAENCQSKQYKVGDTYTVSANLSGLPAIAFPAGFSTNNLPLGVQLLGNYLSDPLLFQLANAYQKSTDWHTKAPCLGETE